VQEWQTLLFSRLKSVLGDHMLKIGPRCGALAQLMFAQVEDEKFLPLRFVRA
jgi:hypothetical protein